MRLKLGMVCISDEKCRRLPYSPNRRMHWGEKSRWAKAWKEAVFWAYYEAGVVHKRPLPEFAIITVYLYTTRPQDQDNSVASVKPIVDGLKGLAIIDDDPTHCEIRVITEKVAHKTEERVEIEII